MENIKKEAKNIYSYKSKEFEALKWFKRRNNKLIETRKRFSTP